MLPTISLNFRLGGERVETKAERVGFQRCSQRDIRFSCALQNFLLAPCYKACAFYLETAELASRTEGKKKKQRRVTRCIVASIFWDGGKGWGRRGANNKNSILTAFSWRTIFSHLHRSKRAKISQFLLVCVPPIHSHRTNMLWVLLASIAGRSSLVKVWIQFYWLFAGLLPDYMCDYCALRQYK